MDAAVERGNRDGELTEARRQMAREYTRASDQLQFRAHVGSDGGCAKVSRLCGDGRPEMGRLNGGRDRD